MGCSKDRKGVLGVVNERERGTRGMVSTIRVLRVGGGRLKEAAMRMEETVGGNQIELKV